MGLRKYLSFLPIKAFRERPPRVALIHLTGVIGGFGAPFRHGLTLAGLEKVIEKAFQLDDLQAVALAINSPGGSPVQSELIAKRIRDLAKEKDVKVLAFCEDVAASGGYWLAAAGDEIFVQESSIIGSIGVISAGFGFQGLIERFGVERRVYTSGEKKSTLDPFKAEKTEDVERLKALQIEIHENFKNWVRKRREGLLKSEDDVLFSGEFWAGRKAVELGLADGIGELRETARDRYGDKVKIVHMKPRRSWLKEKLSGGGEARMFSSSPSLLPSNWAGELLAAVEERSLWNRFGL